MLLAPAAVEIRAVRETMAVPNALPVRQLRTDGLSQVRMQRRCLACVVCLACDSGQCSVQTLLRWLIGIRHCRVQSKAADGEPVLSACRKVLDGRRM